MVFVLPTVLGMFHITKDDREARKQRELQQNIEETVEVKATGTDDTVPWNIDSIINASTVKETNQDAGYKFPVSNEEEERILVFTKKEDGTKEPTVTDVKPEEEVATVSEIQETVAETQPEEKKEEPVKEPVVKDIKIKKLEKVFKNFLKHQKYAIEESNGIYILNITRQNGNIDQYLVDDGSVMGGTDISVLGTTETNDTLFVPLGQAGLVRKILESKNYKIPEKQIEVLTKEYFKNTSIYRYIDFTNTPWFDTISVSEKDSLELALGAIIKEIVTRYGASAPRFRFVEFHNSADFTVISDSEVHSQLAEINETSAYIVNGLKIKVSGTKYELFGDEKLLATGEIQ